MDYKDGFETALINALFLKKIIHLLKLWMVVTPKMEHIVQASCISPDDRVCCSGVLGITSSIFYISFSDRYSINDHRSNRSAAEP